MAIVIIYLLLSISNSVLSSSYPIHWIKRGECLDFNEGPLQRDIVPLKNENVLMVNDQETIDKCSTECFKLSSCGYFTFYDNSNRTEGDCLLVGFNLKAPCFEFKNKCVLLKDCQEFSTHCQNCSTGIRPPTDKPSENERVLFFNGDVDDPNYLENESELMSENITNNMEMITNKGACMVEVDGLIPRIGSVGIYTHNEILNCGGYSSSNSSYLSTCLSLTPHSLTAWNKSSDLIIPRAYASGVHMLGKAYILGGYDSNLGFLDSVEIYANGTWNISRELNLLKGKSHFCAFTTSKNEIIIVGGWNGEYLKDVDIVKFYSNGTIKEGWKSFPTMMKEPRSDTACLETQISWEKGFLVAGGYDAESTWKNSIEFYSYDKGKWMTINSLPTLITPRHYHGIALLNYVPIVFGGWSNGALNSVESLDMISQEDNDLIKWRQRPDLKLILRREKFGYINVPASFENLKC